VKIVVAGGTGFLGGALTARLADDGHDVVALSRRGQEARGGRRVVAWTPDGGIGPWASEVDGAAAVINLAGESIAGRRWSNAHKQRILESRIRATRSLTASIAAASSRPRVMVSGSGINYYGPRGDDIVDEATPAGDDFLAGVCVQWEAEANRAAGSGTRVACVRTAMVLERDGGALPRMLPPFRFGVGGPVGSGRQYWSWIHRADWVELVRWIIANDSIAGPINATGPEPVKNATFADLLGRALRRPSFMPAPAFALRLMLGEMADPLLLSGQRAVPARAEAAGFRFKHPRLEHALAAIFG
jgi:uncharacterized protein (TIGR01777 family)